MIKYITKRILLMIPVIIAVTALIFILLALVPGDPARLILGNSATVEMITQKRHELGLDQPLMIRMLTYMRDIFFRFDFGTSYYNTTPIISEIAQRLPRTMIIAGGSIVIIMIVGIFLGVLAAVNQNGVIDRICMLISMIGVALPEFCVAMLLVLLFSTKLHWLPSHGISSAACYIMPILACSLQGIAGLSRHTRNATLEAIHSDYVTTARSKGVREKDVIFKHVLPNSMIPVITSLGATFAASMGGTIIIENVFSIPGMGQYIVTAINSRDYMVVQGSVVVLAIIFSLIMLAVDLLYAVIDPRIKAQYVGTKKRRKSA